MRADLGSLDRVEQIVKVFGMVNVGGAFDQMPAVIDGCSDLLVEVFGDRGRHTRSAVGMAALPFGIAVEIELIARRVQGLEQRRVPSTSCDAIATSHASPIVNPAR